MSFIEELTKRNLAQLMYGTTFKKVVPMGGKVFIDMVKDIVDNNRSVYLDPDCDIDGYLSVLTLKTMFDTLGHTNYFIPTHVYKRHGIGQDAVKAMLRENKFDYYIITDSSTNAVDVFDLFLKHPEVKCICIDHHVSNTDRSMYKNTNVLLINPKLDSLEKGRETLAHDMSACAIVSLLVDVAVDMLYPDKYDDLKGAHWVYGYITLYSDSCKFSWYNIAYARRVVSSHFPNPPLVDMFMNQYSTLNRTFVSWTLAPRLNALLRAEYFNIAHDVFYNPEKVKSEGTLDFIESTYQESKTFVGSLVASAKIIERDNIVVGFLPDIARARNYTGLVASDLSTKYSKPAMVLLHTSQQEYEGSVRDLYSRNLLDTFKTAVYAEGHSPAFGVKIGKDELDDALYLLNSLLHKISTTNEGVILLDWSCYTHKDKSLREDLQLMTEYNEFSGQGLPVAYAQIPIRSNMQIKPGPKVTRIKWGPDIEMLVFGRYISSGDTVVVEPSWPNKLVVKSIYYKI